jgi:DNA mismatch repair protein MutS2
LTSHALAVLEFGRVLERVAERAASDLGRERVLSVRPSDSPEVVGRELARVAATVRFISEDPGWGMPPVPDVYRSLAQLTAAGAVFEANQLHRVGLLLEASRRLRTAFSSREGRYPELETVADLLLERKDTESAISRAVDAEGHVLDGASRELKKVRARLRGAHAKIVRRLEDFLRTVPERFIVPDASVTIREGRYVVPIRREGKGAVGGVVHDESQSGATLFMEPPMAMALMSELRELEREEAREVRRVLEELTARVAPDRDALVGALDALVDFDSLQARARSAVAWRAELPTLRPEGERGLDIRDGRHPLLLEAEGEAVIPFDLELAEDEYAMVVSGPNTGGKSVFLKATGLVCALAQSGVIPPVGKGTTLPVYRNFFADIGDGQSIEENLSTFSAHLDALASIVTEADTRSLVLIDEMGTGTDPAEGAALARAVLEELVARGATALVSSHLGEMKRLDAEGSGVVNASLQFDGERMEPTYRLIKGRPGRSYGLAIARRRGFPERVLDRAEEHREGDEARMEEILARLERQERQAEELVRELDEERSRAERLRVDFEARERVLKAAEATSDERAREDARKLLMDARSEVESAIREVRAAAGDEAALEEVSREARRRVEAAAARQRRRSAHPASRGGVPDVSTGDHVRIHATGAKGEVVEVRGDRALVEAGAVRLEVPLADVERVDGAPEAPGPLRSGGGWRAPERPPARSEVDLRGMRVGEMELELTRALDAAIIEDLSELRIIHGKGTGALRQKVGEMLAADGRVRAFRMGEPTEGGAGVTVVDFRGDG